MRYSSQSSTHTLYSRAHGPVGPRATQEQRSSIIDMSRTLAHHLTTKDTGTSLSLTTRESLCRMHSVCTLRLLSTHRVIPTSLGWMAALTVLISQKITKFTTYDFDCAEQPHGTEHQRGSHPTESSKLPTQSYLQLRESMGSTKIGHMVLIHTCLKS